MIPADILKKVRRVELRTRRLVNTIFAGEYHSVFKGQGMAFSEVREYQPGDETRTIDWNVTARMGEPFVKEGRSRATLFSWEKAARETLEILESAPSPTSPSKDAKTLLYRAS